jgi:hypothetical protein
MAGNLWLGARARFFAEFARPVAGHLAAGNIPGALAPATVKMTQASLLNN